jgi:hypothetical protein
MNDALFGTEPSQLGIRGQTPPESGKIRGDVVEPTADDEVAERLDAGGADFVAAADGKRQAVALEARIGPQDHVRRGVIGVDVDGVGTRVST